MRLRVLLLAAGMVAAVAPAVPAPARALGAEAMIVPVQAGSESAFPAWVKAFRQRALAQGITAEVFEAAFAGIRYNATIVGRDRNQSEFVKQIWDYLDSAVSPERVTNGKAALAARRKLLDEIEARYGVEAEIVAAIWGLESAYGSFRGSSPIIESLATLAFDGRRARFFEDQLIAALRILQSGDARLADFKGSWAGAMGHTQFMPTSFLAYAEDFRGDGRRDIWGDDPTDALASAASYLARHGWQKGQPWGLEVTLPATFDFSLAGERTKKSVGEWAALGVVDTNGKPIPDHGRASILVPAGSRGPAFIIFDNFHVISRYNAANSYVIAVGHLSDRLVGAGGFKASWPRDDRSLSRSERQELQESLAALGFDPGGVDGIIGPNTIAAVRAFQRSIGLLADGYASLDLLNQLRRRRS